MFSKTKLMMFALVLSFGSFVMAQEEPQPPTNPAVPATTETPTEEKTAEEKPAQTETWEETAKKEAAKAEKKIKDIASDVDKDPHANQIKAGILQPIYLVAENLNFSAFHWLAFALMAAGVFNYALQLLLGKLVVLMRAGFSLREILSDVAGFAISLVGLVLTTQAAAENSTFTQSAAAVISATLAGAVFGFVLYCWGQSAELEAVEGRIRQAKASKR